jgi:virginiamycin B lyase
MMLAAVIAVFTAGAAAHAKMEMRTFPVLAGAGAHDVYPAADGAVWFTAQSAGKLGRLDPRTGKSDYIALGPGAAPHGVIVGPDGTAWVTEGGRSPPASRPLRRRAAASPAARAEVWGAESGADKLFVIKSE